MTAKHLNAAIVTGISRGLGEALATALLARGFVVLGIGRLSSMKLRGERYRFAECDLSKPSLIAASVAPALRDIAELRPRAVTLVNNAAVATPAGVLGALDAAAIETALATNLTAPIVLADLFCRAFPDASMGRRVINVSSGAAQSAIAGSAAYCVSKAGIEMLTRSLAADHPEIESIAVRPGIFETGMQSYLRSLNPAEFPSVALFRGFKTNGLLKEPAEVAARIVERLVLGKVEQGRTYTHVDLGS
ncbi:MAG TPA: SDR family NAD(P)-dependent oxidoreductase [Casimicrobiaceae bacterium]|nr:SDR family NAD(P)-dependent oxidoreductase [Casimicrobiaceae bacterium]